MCTKSSFNIYFSFLFCSWSKSKNEIMIHWTLSFVILLYFLFSHFLPFSVHSILSDWIQLWFSKGSVLLIWILNKNKIVYIRLMLIIRLLTLGRLLYTLLLFPFYSSDDFDENDDYYRDDYWIEKII